MRSVNLFLNKYECTPRHYFFDSYWTKLSTANNLQTLSLSIKSETKTCQQIRNMSSQRISQVTNVDFASWSVRPDKVVTSEVVEIVDVPGCGGDGEWQLDRRGDSADDRHHHVSHDLPSFHQHNFERHYISSVHIPVSSGRRHDLWTRPQWTRVLCVPSLSHFENSYFYTVFTDDTAFSFLWTIKTYFVMITHHFSGPCWAIGPVCVRLSG